MRLLLVAARNLIKVYRKYGKFGRITETKLN